MTDDDVRKHSISDHYEYHDFWHVPHDFWPSQWFCVTVVIIGELCTKSLKSAWCVCKILHVFYFRVCAGLPTSSMCPCNFITVLHVMQTRYSEENSVCLSVYLSVRLSVCPSVTRVIPDKTEERSVQICIPYERIFILVFWEGEWLVGGDPFYLKFWVNRPPLEQNRRFSTNNRS